ncbi:hypothetical protein [Nocardioides plantarum]|uniref:Secreted protein n=1 Tax=Nocardioides plantarum TaxID=29299 RepID=A0ABV5K7L5_9ACTN|nr:hypothetical protein [Nocardioides plantarum]
MTAPRPLRLLTLLAALVVLVAAPTAVPAAQAAGASSAGARDADLTTYRSGISVRRETNVSTKLAKLPADYRRAVRAWLERAYQEAGADEACANSPRLTAYAYHRDGFVTSSQGISPATGEPDSCAQGGYASIWSKRGGPWREVIKGQEPPSCRALVWHRVPRSMVDRCFDDQGQPVTY